MHYLVFTFDNLTRRTHHCRNCSDIESVAAVFKKYCPYNGQLISAYDNLMCCEENTVRLVSLKMVSAGTGTCLFRK